MFRHLDAGTLATLAVTLALFIVALFVKGLTHDLLLEAGVFLVSVKLVIATYKASVTAATLERKLDEIHADLRRLQPPPNPQSAPSE